MVSDTLIIIYYLTGLVIAIYYFRKHKAFGKEYQNIMDITTNICFMILCIIAWPLVIIGFKLLKDDN